MNIWYPLQILLLLKDFTKEKHKPVVFLTTETQFQREKNIAVLWTDFVDIRREIKSVFTSHIAFIQVKVQTGWTQIW